MPPSPAQTGFSAAAAVAAVQQSEAPLLHSLLSWAAPVRHGAALANVRFTLEDLGAIDKAYNDGPEEEKSEVTVVFPGSPSASSASSASMQESMSFPLGLVRKMHWFFSKATWRSAQFHAFAATHGRQVWLLLGSCNYALCFSSSVLASEFCFALLQKMRNMPDLSVIHSVKGATGLISVGFIDSPGLYDLVSNSLYSKQNESFTASALVLQRCFRAKQRLVKAAVSIQHFWRRVVFRRRVGTLVDLARALSLRDAGLHELSATIIHFAAYTHAAVCRQFGLVNMLVGLVKQSCAMLRPNITVEVFGSMATGLALPSSDVDLVCNADVHELEKIAWNLSASTGGSAQIVGTPPVLKFKTHLYGVLIKMDLTMASAAHTGLETVLLVRHWLRTDPRLGPVVLVIKQFLFERGLGQVYTGGLSSHAIFVMTVALRHIVSPTATQGELLLKFLSSYSQPGFFQQFTVSVARGFYPIAALEERQADLLPPAVIEDPIRLGNNLGAGSFRIRDVQRAFKEALAGLDRGQGLRGALVMHCPWFPMRYF